MRDIKDEDIVKVGIFGFAVVRSIDGYLYCLNIENQGDMAKVCGRLIKKEDTIEGLLPAPTGTFAYYGCMEGESGVFRPNEDLLGIEYPGEKATDWKKILQERQEKNDQRFE